MLQPSSGRIRVKYYGPIKLKLVSREVVVLVLMQSILRPSQGPSQNRLEQIVPAKSACLF